MERLEKAPFKEAARRSRNISLSICYSTAAIRNRKGIKRRLPSLRMGLDFCMASSKSLFFRLFSVFHTILYRGSMCIDMFVVFPLLLLLCSV